MSHLKNRAAFTLIELLVVVIIVAVLAAVGLPLLTGNIQRARLSEADAGLGAIRNSMRAQLAEHGNYNTVVTTGNIVGQNVGLNTGDLDGRWFEDDDYKIQDIQPNSFCAVATGDEVGTAPRGKEVAGITRSMDQFGHIRNSANCTTGAVLN